MKGKKGVELFVNSWNKFVETLIELERLWKLLTKLKGKYEISIEDFPDESQKVLSRVNFRSRFTVGIVRFVEFIERYGAFEECLIKKMKNEKEKEKEVTDGR